MEKMEVFEVRDEVWLAERVSILREVHFADVPQGLPIVTRFGPRAQYRFGSIAERQGVSLIMVNRLFANLRVPVFVLDGTLAHELAHYAHGFGSGLPRLYLHPHRGGVVDIELAKRGLGELDRKADEWRKAHWDTFYKSQCGDITERKTVQSETIDAVWRRFIEQPGNRTESDINHKLQILMKQMKVQFTENRTINVEWMHASVRQKGLSYWFPIEGKISLHGLLSDRRVPETVIEFELSYWLARLVVGSNWQKVHAVLNRVGLGVTMENGVHWRTKSWPSFMKRNHPI